MKGKGFDRLRGVAAAGAMGIGLLGGASVARGAPTTTPVSVTVSSGTWSAWWTYISNYSSVAIITDPAATTYPTTSMFNISSASLATAVTTLGDLFDNAFQLIVDGVGFVEPDGIVDLTGTTVTTDTVVLSGLNTQIQYYFAPGRPVLRALYSFHNPTGSPISASAFICGDLGSNGSTTVQATSDGDLIIENTDNWYVSNDNTTVGGEPNSDPDFTLSRFGIGTVAVVPTWIAAPGTDWAGYTDWFSERYNITVPPGETVRIMMFCEMSMTNAGAVAGATDFESLEAADAAGLLTGLSQTERGEIVNYEQAPPAAVPTMGQWGMMFLSGLLGLFGLGALRRRKKE